MKSSICIILNKLNLFNKNRKNKLYNFFEELSQETLKDIDYSKKFIVIFDEEENFLIQKMIINSLKKSNKKVIYNKKVYDNPTRFILKSSSILSFTINADAFILSINRKSLKYIDMKKVDYFIINDLNRNYPYRNNDEEDAIKNIIKSLKSNTKIILNLDNPYTNIVKYYHKGKTIGYGIKSDINKSSTNIVKCPICHENLIYKSRYFLNYGNYICPNGDFDTGIKSFEANNISFINSHFKINNNKLKLNTHFYYDIYYLLSFYAIAKNLKINSKIIEEEINQYKDDISSINDNNKEYTLFNVENGNIINYQKIINYVSSLKKPVLLGFSNIFDNSSLDLSWLYEIDFKPLKNIEKIYIIGMHKIDIKVRLLYDKLNIKLIDTIEEITQKNVNVIMPHKEFLNYLGGNK